MLRLCSVSHWHGGSIDRALWTCPVPSIFRLIGCHFIIEQKKGSQGLISRSSLVFDVDEAEKAPPWS